MIELDPTRKPMAHWRARCDCGTEKTVRGEHLRSGKVVSCGCWKRELTIERSRTHGKRHTPEWSVWSHMLQRCQSPGASNYERYGARGIAVCPRWRGRDGFANFLADMGPRPTKTHSIDRIDGSLGYAPENCRWATPAQQGANRRGVIHVEHEGRTQSLRAWAIERGLLPELVHLRVRRGLTPKQALEIEPSSRVFVVHAARAQVGARER